MKTPLRNQSGFLLIEGMIAILIFALGILGMVAMSATAIGAQSDARARTDAASLADEISSQIALNVNRTSPGALSTSLASFANFPVTVPNQTCQFAGAASVNPLVVNWVAKVNAAGAALAGATNFNQQIQVFPANPGSTNFNKVQVTICWKAPADLAPRQHTLVTFVN